MPVVEKKAHKLHQGGTGEREFDLLTALIEAADPDLPPSDDEILSLILDELVPGPRRSSRTQARSNNG